MATVGVSVNYCHLDRAFLHHVLRECRHFSSKVAVVYGDKYTNGKEQPPPDRSVVEEFPEVQFIRYTVDAREHHGSHWMNVARQMGWLATAGTDYTLFLDADEVPEGERFAAFVGALPAGAAAAQAPCMKLANYWYFRYPWLRAKRVDDSIVLVPRASLTTDGILHAECERSGLIGQAPLRRVVDSSRRPMFHHYSWVRTHEDLYTKVAVWGHKNDTDWAALLDRELAVPVDPTLGAEHRDLVFGQASEVVLPAFDITLEPTPPARRGQGPRLAVYYSVGCNDGFARLFAASCRSLRRWHPPGDADPRGDADPAAGVDVYVMCEPEFRAALEKHAPAAELGYRVVEVAPRPTDADCSMRKLAPPRCLSAYDKALFLDCDIVVCRPMNDVFDVIKKPGVLYVVRERGSDCHTHRFWSIGLHSQRTLEDFVERDVGVFNAGQFGFVPGADMDRHFAAIRGLIEKHGTVFVEQPSMNHYFATTPKAVSWELGRHVYLNATADDVKPERTIAHFMGWGAACDDKLDRMVRYLAKIDEPAPESPRR